jgi:hypothetical protein
VVSNIKPVRVPPQVAAGDFVLNVTIVHSIAQLKSSSSDNIGVMLAKVGLNSKKIPKQLKVGLNPQKSLT